jgi:uncharacterized membrane protein
MLRLTAARAQSDTAVVVAAADALTVAPSLELVLWTVFVIGIALVVVLGGLRWTMSRRRRRSARLTSGT